MIIKPKNHGKGLLEEPVDERDFVYGSFFSTIKNWFTPEQISFVPDVDHSPYMSVIKNQGSAPKCTAFASAAVAEWYEINQWRNWEGKSDYPYNPHKDLSEQWIYYYASKCDPFPEDTAGSTLRAAMKVLKKKGVPAERAWKYNTDFTGAPADWAGEHAELIKASSYWKIKNLKGILEVLQSRPITAGIEVYDEFERPRRDGTVKLPSGNNNYSGLHAVCFCGCSRDKELVKVRNSWGKRYGKKGYCWLPFEYIKRHLRTCWAFDDMHTLGETAEELNSFRGDLF